MQTLIPDYSEIQKQMEALLPDKTNLSFEKLVSMLTRGDTDTFFDTVKEILSIWLSSFTLPFSDFGKLLLILILSAVLSNVLGLFVLPQTADMGFYIAYMLCMTYLIGGFMEVSAIAADTMRFLIQFMSVLLPTYLATVAFTTGALTAAAYYSTAFFAIGAVEVIFAGIVLRMVQCYMVLSLLNNLFENGIVNYTLQLIDTLVVKICRWSMVFILGITSVKSLLLPKMDEMKRSALLRSASLLPGVDKLADNAFETAIGAGTLLKNAIGIVGTIILVLLVLLPIGRLGIRIGLYRLLAMLTEPITDKRIGKCLIQTERAVILLLKTIWHGIVLMILMVALIAVSTS